ncbi:hypothetical protein D3C80_1350450 [compost metagenome]
MAQQFLHRTQIAAGFQHVRGKRMSQFMRMDMAVHALFHAPLGKPFLDVSRRNTAAFARQKHRIILRIKISAPRQPVFKPGDGRPANRHFTFFAAFPQHAHFAGGHIDMFAVDTHQFRKTQSRAVHHFQHRPVTHGKRIVEVDFQQFIHFIDIKIFRQMFGGARRRNTFGGVGAQYALTYQPVEKAAQ